MIETLITKLPRATLSTIAGIATVGLALYLLAVGKIDITTFGGMMVLAAPFLGIVEHSTLPTRPTQTGEAVVVTGPSVVRDPVIPLESK